MLISRYTLTLEPDIFAAASMSCTRTELVCCTAAAKVRLLLRGRAARAAAATATKGAALLLQSVPGALHSLNLLSATVWQAAAPLASAAAVWGQGGVRSKICKRSFNIRQWRTRRPPFTSSTTAVAQLPSLVARGWPLVCSSEALLFLRKDAPKSPQKIPMRLWVVMPPRAPPLLHPVLCRVASVRDCMQHGVCAALLLLRIGRLSNVNFAQINASNKWECRGTEDLCTGLSTLEGPLAIRLGVQGTCALVGASSGSAFHLLQLQMRQQLPQKSRHPQGVGKTIQQHKQHEDRQLQQQPLWKSHREEALEPHRAQQLQKSVDFKSRRFDPVSLHPKPSAPLGSYRAVELHVCGVLAYKVGMMSLWDGWGEQHAVTVCQVDRCVVLEQKTLSTHGYEACVLGLGYRSPLRVSRPNLCKFLSLGIEPKAVTAEFKVGLESPRFLCAPVLPVRSSCALHVLVFEFPLPLCAGAHVGSNVRRPPVAFLLRIALFIVVLRLFFLQDRMQATALKARRTDPTGVLGKARVFSRRHLNAHQGEAAREGHAGRITREHRKGGNSCRQMNRAGIRRRVGQSRVEEGCVPGGVGSVLKISDARGKTHHQRNRQIPLPFPTFVPQPSEVYPLVLNRPEKKQDPFAYPEIPIYGKDES
ncbi:ribosomal protein [Cyclospora cayetanensis]|uniref:Ribosomal protein n=1 Tax=Cyclospora cayetanensis TaxID=88456 RepID=A0A1D3DB65_9EIME|nr:ribosomal protein [Cyclospora cayetanensis]